LPRETADNSVLYVRIHAAYRMYEADWQLIE